MVELSAVWEQVKYLLSENISLIPVRDKEEPNKSGKPYPAKSAWSWTYNKTNRYNEEQLWKQMEYRDTAAIGIVAGEISGNLEVIDIDVKHKPGIDALLFKSIEAFYPALYEQLRIHKSPSGGYHILYKIRNHEVPGNFKLAGRETTQEERDFMIASGNKPNKEVHFLETRGEGGYVLAPPSMGYTVLKDNPIPVITWEERCSLISLCKSYTEIVKVIPPPKPAKSQDEMYTLNPFEDYNARTDVTEILAEYGWDEFKEDHKYIWFTRPGKDSGVSASWNKETEIFFVFTSSTEFEPDKGYHPATILALLKFANDKKKTYRYLTEQGFGVFKPYFEEKRIHKEAINNGELPANYSEAAKEKLTTLKTLYEEKLPHGRFWALNEKHKFEISREDLYYVAHELGYRLYNRTQIVKIENNLVYQQTDKEFYNRLKTYIWEEAKNLFVQICNAFEAFLQKSGTFTITRLQDINKTDILQDTQYAAYKYFSNGILHIEANRRTLLPYTGVQGFLWAHKITTRPWTEKPAQSVYKTFLENAIGITSYLKKIIGYLAHDHKSESSGYLIVLTEKTVDPKDGGGSGKNIFGNILTGTTTVKTVPGSSIQFNDKFLSAWNYERVYFLADIPRKIDWLFLKEMVTGAGYSNKKYIAETDVPKEDMPKILLNTNYSYEDEDGGVKRRIRQLEFTSFYTKNGGVDTAHGKMFPDDWTTEDWTGYDQFIADSLQELFRAKGKIELMELSEEGWTKKFHMRHHETTYTFISNNINDWCESEFVANATIMDQYHDFCREENTAQRFKKELNSLSIGIKDYCHHYGIQLVSNVSGRTDGFDNSVKGKIFGEINDIL